MLLAGYVLTVQIDMGDAWVNAVDPRQFTVIAHKECAWNEELLRLESDTTELLPIKPEEAEGKTCDICGKPLTEKAYYAFQAERLVIYPDLMAQNSAYQPKGGCMDCYGNKVSAHYSPPIIRYENGDEPVHTPEHPFCDDPTCVCHDDQELITDYLLQPQNAGLLTLDEAASLYYGKQL